jgi:TolB protein
MAALIVAAVLVACAAALLTVEQKAEAAFPGKNGRIAYSAFFDGSRGDAIYTIAPGGAGNTRVTGGYYPSYSPDGERIAYSQFTYNDAEIYTIDPDGSGKTQLTHNNTKDDVLPSYSPNGKRIAYTRILRSSSPDTEIEEIYEIFTVKVGGGGKTRVTYGQNPSYSPDGERIVYEGFDETSSKRFPDLEIFTIDVRGGDKTQLTHNSTDDIGPDYSPDGKRIAYVHTSGTQDDDRVDSDIYTIKVGGGDKSRVTNTDKADEYDLSYSPDGKKIAYILYKGNDLQSDIYTIDASGGGRTRVTNTDNKAFVQGPSWGSRP